MSMHPHPNYPRLTPEERKDLREQAISEASWDVDCVRAVLNEMDTPQAFDHLITHVLCEVSSVPRPLKDAARKVIARELECLAEAGRLNLDRKGRPYVSDTPLTNEE